VVLKLAGTFDTLCDELGCLDGGKHSRSQL
jgi:hypothetical protein